MLRYHCAVPTLTPRGLERRLKRHLLKAEAQLFASAAPGFEPELEAEVRALPGVVSVERTTGGVAFSGPLDLVYHANLKLRTAHRVLLRIETFYARSLPMLYDHLRKVRWERYLGFHDDVAVSVRSKASRLMHADAIRESAGEAIRRSVADLGLAPRSVERSPRTVVLRLFRDRCTVSLDTSGQHLHRRRYRGFLGRAPIRETLAAAILMRVGVERYPVVVDPFCGSGTLLIEAATHNAGLPPGLGRKFGFEGLAFFDAGRWERIVAGTLDAAESGGQRFVGSDLDAGAVEGARRNAIEAGVEDACSFGEAAAEELTLPSERGPGLILSNPPYGVRVSGAEGLLARLLERLADRGSAWDLALIVRDPAPIVGSAWSVTKSTPFRNGGLAVHLVEASRTA